MRCFFNLPRMPSKPLSRLVMTGSHIQGASYSSYTVGSKYTSDFKVYLQLPNGQIGSYFHDIPIDLNKELRTINVVIEIPRWTNAKFEVNKEELMNPITQDTKKGQLRYVKNLFPFKGYLHNYGAVPQTWDDPTVEDKGTGFKGDNDPIDVCEIGSRVAELGEVIKVKVLGSLALIDDGELDWKVIAIDVNDPLAPKLNDIQDVVRECPGLLESTRRWFKDYKIPDGKPENVFGYNGEYQSSLRTTSVIEDSNKAWKKLINAEVSLKNAQSIANTTLNGTPGFIDDSNNVNIDVKDPKPAAEIPSAVDKVYYTS